MVVVCLYIMLEYFIFYFFLGYFLCFVTLLVRVILREHREQRHSILRSYNGEFVPDNGFPYIPRQHPLATIPEV